MLPAATTAREADFGRRRRPPVPPRGCRREPCRGRLDGRRHREYPHQHQPGRRLPWSTPRTDAHPGHRLCDRPRRPLPPASGRLRPRFREGNHACSPRLHGRCRRLADRRGALGSGLAEARAPPHPVAVEWPRRRSTAAITPGSRGRRVAFDLLGLDPVSRTGAALQFFVADLAKPFALLVIVIYLMGLLRALLAPERVRAFVRGRPDWQAPRSRGGRWRADALLLLVLGTPVHRIRRGRHPARRHVFIPDRQPDDQPGCGGHRGRTVPWLRAHGLGHGAPRRGCLVQRSGRRAAWHPAVFERHRRDPGGRGDAWQGGCPGRDAGADDGRCGAVAARDANPAPGHSLARAGAVCRRARAGLHAGRLGLQPARANDEDIRGVAKP